MYCFFLHNGTMGLILVSEHHRCYSKDPARLRIQMEQDLYLRLNMACEHICCLQDNGSSWLYLGLATDVIRILGAK